MNLLQRSLLNISEAALQQVLSSLAASDAPLVKKPAVGKVVAILVMALLPLIIREFNTEFQLMDGVTGIFLPTDHCPGAASFLCIDRSGDDSDEHGVHFFQGDGPLTPAALLRLHQELELNPDLPIKSALVDLTRVGDSVSAAAIPKIDTHLDKLRQKHGGELPRLLVLVNSTPLSNRPRLMKTFFGFWQQSLLAGVTLGVEQSCLPRWRPRIR